MFAFWPGKLQILLDYSAIYFSNTIIANCSTILMRELKFEYERFFVIVENTRYNANVTSVPHAEY